MSSKLKPARPAPPPAPIQQLHHYATGPGTPRKPATSMKTSWACRCTTSSRATMCQHRRVLPLHPLFFPVAGWILHCLFDLGDDQAAEPSPNTPLWVNHIAFRLNSLEELEAMKARFAGA